MPKIFKDKNNNVLYTGYETDEVVANPTLVGTESELTGIQIGNTKYKAPEGFSGDYNDLTNKPTIPTVNNPTITFTQGGVNKGSITLNQSSNETIVLDAGGGGGGGAYNADDGIVIKNSKFIEEGWERKEWREFVPSNNKNVWTDGENTYYSQSSQQYVLDKETSTWVDKVWYDLAYFNGENIWTDGENIYYSYNSSHKVLDKATSTWSTKTWQGLSSLTFSFSSDDVWTDGENTYYSHISDQYVLDKATSTWLPKTWTGLTSFIGNQIWTDGENIYCYRNSSSSNYVLNKATSTWVDKEWFGLDYFDPSSVWTDGENIYCSFGGCDYVLNKATFTWYVKTWNGFPAMQGNYVWTDGENVYYSKGAEQAILIKTPVELSNVIELENKNVSSFTQSKRTSFSPKWQEVSFHYQNIYYLPYAATKNIWTDGEKIYMSWGSDQHVLDKPTLTWSPKTWTGLTSFDGEDTWTDGENIYYSAGETHYVLDKATSTWSQKTWNGLDYFFGNNVWTDGENIYCSAPNNYYVLDKATSTWSIKQWMGIEGGPDGHNVWTDGKNIYYSDENGIERVLNKETSIWSEKKWEGVLYPRRDLIWTDGENIYYSYPTNNSHYILNKSTSTWVRINVDENVWKDLLGDTGNYLLIWTDGSNVYHTESIDTSTPANNKTYKLTKPSSTINARPVLTSGSSSSGSSESSNTQAVLFSGEDLTKGFLGVTDAEATTIPINYENLRKILTKEGYDLIDAPVGEGTVLSQTGDIFKLTICPSVINPTAAKLGEGLIEIYTEEVNGSYNLQIKTACPDYALGHIDNYTIESGETENLGDILTKVGAAVETTPEDFNEFTFLLANSYYEYRFSNLIILHRDAIDDYEYVRIKDVDTFIKLVFKSSGGGSSDGE